MFKFLLGVMVGAAGFWAYRFWKGDDDLSWEQPFATTSPTTSSSGAFGTQPVGSTSAGAGASESGSSPQVPS